MMSLICIACALLVANASAEVKFQASHGDGIRGSANRKKHSQHVFRRLFSEENALVRDEIEILERNSTDYWKTGIRANPEFKVGYVNHPFDLMEQERQRRKRHLNDAFPHLSSEEVEMIANRDLQNSTNTTLYKPLRISFRTNALDNMRTSENAAKIDFIKNKILPGIAKFWSSALNVVPVVGNLKIQPGDLANRQYCGDSEFSLVPASDISDGVPDTDLVAYVSGTPSTRFCGPSTLAVAVACNFDQFDRPTAGNINFCLDQIQLNADGTANEADIVENTSVGIHEMCHVLGMSSNSYRYFWDITTGKPRTARPFKTSTVTCVTGVQQTLALPDTNTMTFSIASNGQRYATIVTPTVQTIVRNHFNCPSLSGARLEVS